MESVEQQQPPQIMDDGNEVKLEAVASENIDAAGTENDETNAAASAQDEADCEKSDTVKIEPGKDDSETTPVKKSEGIVDANDTSAQHEAKTSDIKQEDKFDVVKCETLLREIVTADTILTMSKNSARCELEKRLGVDEGSMKVHRKAVNDLLHRIVSEIEVPDEGNGQQGESDEPEESSAAAASTENSHKRPTTERRTSRSSAKRQRLDDAGEASGTNSHNDDEARTDDESLQQTSDEESTYEEPASSRKRKKTKAAPKMRGMKQAQHNVMTKAEFLKSAQEVEVRFGPLEIVCAPKEFNTGSCGWGHSGKVWLKVGDKEINCQLSLNCAVVGSKTWKRGRA